jgi:hypothetical protein
MLRRMPVFVLIISVFLLLSVSPPQPSRAQAALSPGCANLNDSSYDVMASSVFAPALDFYAGETVTVAADYPISGSGPPIWLRIVVGGTIVDDIRDSFPATLTYTFAGGTNTTVWWFSSIWLTGENTAVTWTASCTGAPKPPSAPASTSSAAPVIVPGCDVFLDIPDTAVVGAFVETVVADWMPGESTVPVVTLEASKTAWVLGVDESGAYYKIYWGCQTLWVPVGAMGPNYDDVWHGKPLPTEVVDSTG